MLSQKRKKPIRTLPFLLSDTVFSSVLHSYSPVVKDSQMQNKDICHHAGKFPKIVTLDMNQQPLLRLTTEKKNTFTNLFYSVVFMCCVELFSSPTLWCLPSYTSDSPYSSHSLVLFTVQASARCLGCHSKHKNNRKYVKVSCITLI